jgi:hypothetical protein
MSVLAFDPYYDDTGPLGAKVAKPAKHKEIRHFSDAKAGSVVANHAKPPSRGLASLAGTGEGLAIGNPQKTATLAGLAGLAVREPQSVKTYAATIVPCSRCGTPSRPFIAVINPDLWQCDACLPADPIDQAFEAIERQAIIAEGRPAEPVLIAMPVSWADASLIPTPGARCRNCKGNGWWCERDQPKGWRCSTCYPSDNLSADRRREVVT